MPVSIPRSMNCSARVSGSIVKSGMIWLMLSFSPQLIVDMNTGAWWCWFPAEEGKLTCEPFLCVLTSIQRYRLLGWNVYFCLFKKQWIRLCFSSQVFKFAFLGRQISTIWQYDRIVKDWQLNEFWQIYSFNILLNVSQNSHNARSQKSTIANIFQPNDGHVHIH